MQRGHGTWVCACSLRDKYAHRSALYDYSLLIDREISAQEAADFLHLESADTARRLLTEEGYRKTGHGNFTKYEIRSYHDALRTYN